MCDPRITQRFIGIDNNRVRNPFVLSLLILKAV